jgi:hypothetical protein
VGTSGGEREQGEREQCNSGHDVSFAGRIRRRRPRM